MRRVWVVQQDRPEQTLAMVRVFVADHPQSLQEGHKEHYLEQVKESPLVGAQPASL